MSKIEILKNYGGAGSCHGGAGRITLQLNLGTCFNEKNALTWYVQQFTLLSIFKKIKTCLTI